MKGGQSIKVLLDLAFSNNKNIASKAGKVLKTQVFLYESDTKKLRNAFEEGNKIAKEIIESYSKAEFFTKLPEIDEEREHPAFISGNKTFLFGLINFAVSAMKCTPAITIISAVVFDASIARAKESAEKSAIP